VDGAPRILVVEDDPATAAGLVTGLKKAGFEVELATDGATGARTALRSAFDAIVLDLLLPEQSGMDVLAQLESRSKVPVIVLTAMTDLSDRLRCFELGAADFVPKPFWVEEVVARIRSRLAQKAATPPRVRRWADAEVDLDARAVQVAGQRVGLTKHELAILAYLVERPGRAVSRAQLLEHTLDPFEDRNDRTLDSHVARIRKKLGARAASALVTVWGVGYRFEAAEAKSA
jgi:DNA-binding response OmpR family regulator